MQGPAVADQVACLAAVGAAARAAHLLPRVLRLLHILHAHHGLHWLRGLHRLHGLHCHGLHGLRRLHDHLLHGLLLAPIRAPRLVLAVSLAAERGFVRKRVSCGEGVLTQGLNGGRDFCPRVLVQLLRTHRVGFVAIA